MTKLIGNKTVSDCEVGPFISDHSVVEFCIIMNRPTLKTETISYRKLKNIDIDKLVDDMNLDDIKDSEINDMVQEMEYRMMKSLDNQAPLKQKCIVVRDQVPWYTDEVKEQRPKL